MKNRTSAIFICSAFILCLLSCKTEQTKPLTSLPAGPQDTVTSFMAYFYNTVDSTTEVGSYDDPDGPGPMEASIGGVALQKNMNYIVTFRIEDATNPNSSVYLHNKIKSNGKDFKICISNPLGTSVQPTDSDGSMPIGLEDALVTSNIVGNDKINFTIMYQKGVKDGQCESGVTYYHCSIPFSVW